MLKNRHFLYLWLINTVTTVATELFTITVLVTIFEQTNSTLQAAGTMAARSLPAFILGPVAGFLVDRYPRKNVLISMDILRTLFVGVALWFLRSDATIPVAAIYLVMFGLSAADVFHRPARIALIPSLVTQAQLVKANSFILVSSQILMAISYAAGGWLIQAVPLRQIAIGIAAAYAFAVIIELLLVVPKRLGEDGSDSAEKESFRQSVASGWQYLKQHPIARPLTIMETIEHVPHGIWTGALMLAFAVKALNGGATEWGYIVTGYFTGMIIGSIVALGMSDWLSRYPGRIIVFSAAIVGFLTLGFAASPNIWVATTLGLLFGPPFAIRDVAQDALLQSTVDENQLGRVYATREMLRNIVFMLAGLFFAWLSDRMEIRIIYVIGGLMYILTGIYAVSNKALRTSQMNPIPAATAD